MVARVTLKSRRLEPAAKFIDVDLRPELMEHGLPKVLFR
jgi:hypothetical protein